jgi:hypothetical protein
MLLELSEQRPLHLVVMGFSEFIEPGTPLSGDTKVWTVRLKSGAADYRLSSLAHPHGRWLDYCPDSAWKPGAFGSSHGAKQAVQ